MLIPKNPMGQVYALIGRIDSMKVWVGSPEFVKLNRIAIIGAINKLFGVLNWMADLIDKDVNQPSTLEQLLLKAANQKAFERFKDQS